MKIYLLPLVLLLTIFSNAQSIEISDSQYLKMEDEARAEMNRDIDKSFSIAQQIGKSSNPIHRASSAGMKSYLYQLNKNVELSDEQYELALQILRKEPDSKEKTRIRMVLLNYRGLIHLKRLEYSEASEQFEEGKKLALQLNNKKQLIKFLNNIANIQIDARSYKSAMVTLKASDSVFTVNAEGYSQTQYRLAKSLTQFLLGQCYFRYGLQIEDQALVDSAIAHYKIAILYSEEGTTTKLSSQINTTILMAHKGEHGRAEKRYFDHLKACEENEKLDFKSNVLFNLGLLYLKQERYSEAQSFFGKVESLYKKKEQGYWENLYAKYYLAVIQDELGHYDKAEEYLELFETDYNEVVKDYEEEVMEFNYAQGKRDMAADVEALKARILLHRRLIYVYIGSGVILIVILLFFLRKSIVDKRKVKLKLKDFIEKFNQEEDQKKQVYSNTIQNFTINDQKEKEILVALEKLITNEYYLTSNFSLQNASKKIKTNTTYLSHVVNKNFGKSFSEYSNELKVNYVIRQLMENKTYRKYSTQAIAESVGYKSAVSFTRSFKKRTGVTPVQFLRNIER
jgi:YesN/AraC family two-component response regulator